MFRFTSLEVEVEVEFLGPLVNVFFCRMARLIFRSGVHAPMMLKMSRLS